MADPDLTLVAPQLERLITEVASIRDDNAVLTSMVLRLDGTMSALLAEMRATHTQIARMNDRIRKLEDAGSATGS